MASALLRLAVPLYTAVAVFVLSLADGGFFAWTWPWAILAFGAAAVGLSLLVAGARPAPLELAFVVGLAAVAGWQALSAEWAPDPGRALEDALRGTVYVAAAAAFLVLGRAAGPRAVLIGLIAGGAATLAYGLVAHARSATVDPFEGTLLYQPLGYANAIGILAAMLLLLTLSLLVDERARAAQAALVFVVCVSMVALVSTQSRGAWLAGMVGLATTAVFLVLGRGRWLPLWFGLVAMFVVSLLLSPLVVEPARLHATLTDRVYYWPFAWHALDSPLRGLGSGAFAQLWALERPVAVNAIDAHSLFLEMLLELGAVGLVLGVATLSVPLVAALRGAGGWAAGATGAYVAFLVHAAVDWDWEMPAVTIVALGCGAALVVAARRPAPEASTEGPVLSQVLVALHVEPHGEEGQLRAGDQ
jgi:hypothetical protein